MTSMVPEAQIAASWPKWANRPNSGRIAESSPGTKNSSGTAESRLSPHTPRRFLGSSLTSSVLIRESLNN